MFLNRKLGADEFSNPIVYGWRRVDVYNKKIDAYKYWYMRIYREY